MTRPRRALLLIALAAALMALGEASYRDAQDDARHCEEMVATGVWPEEVCE